MSHIQMVNVDIYLYGQLQLLAIPRAVTIALNKRVRGKYSCF